MEKLCETCKPVIHCFKNRKKNKYWDTLAGWKHQELDNHPTYKAINWLRKGPTQRSTYHPPTVTPGFTNPFPLASPVAHGAFTANFGVSASDATVEDARLGGLQDVTLRA